MAAPQHSGRHLRPYQEEAWADGRQHQGRPRCPPLPHRGLTMPRRKQGAAPASARRRVVAVKPVPAVQRLDPVQEALRSLSARSGIAPIRDAWQRRFGEAAPKIQSGDLLLRLLAWRLQVEAYGGLDDVTARQLHLMARALRNDTRTSAPEVSGLETGTILVREWRNSEHRVLVLEDGFEHHGKRYDSLTSIARAITGTNWSGPRFFGLEQRETLRSELHASDDLAEVTP